MPSRLHRYYGAGYLHFITFSCYRRRPLLGNRQRRDLFLKLLDQVRRNYKFVVVGYVVMPEHVHLLLSEPERANPSVVVQVLKQRFARQVIRATRKRQNESQKLLWETEGEEHVWQRRFYDFVVWSEHKRGEKLRYIHGNPVKRGLVLEPEQWEWSSFRFYTYGENGPVLVNEQRPAKLQLRGRAAAIANRTAC
jgi:putative transposase